MVWEHLESIMNPSNAPIFLLITACVVSGLRYYSSSRSSSATEGSGRERSLSFSSEILLSGAFPPKSNVQQPVVNILFYVKKCPSIPQLVSLVEKTLYFDRLRSGARKVPGTNNWVLYDLGGAIEIEKDIIVTMTFKNEDEIRKKADLIAMEEIQVVDHKPLWKIYRLVNENDGRSAMMVRMHHVIGDGISMIGLTKVFFERANGDAYSLDIPEKMRQKTNLGSGLVFIYRSIIALFEVLTLPNSRYDTDTAFCGNHHSDHSMSENRKSVEFPTIKLDFIKELKSAANVTVNDILFSATAGMIRRYCVLKKDPQFPTMNATTNVHTRALLPVAFPRPKKDLDSASKAMRNLWSMVSVPMPVNETSARARIEACCKTTSRVKSSPHAMIQLFLQNNVISLVPQFLAQKTAFDAFSRHTMVFSNVPGPSEMLCFCGEPVLEFRIIFPNLIPQVIVMTYAEKVFYTLSLDQTTVDTELLPKLFIEELKEQARELGVSTSNMF